MPGRTRKKKKGTGMKKRGESGVAAQYITRTRALRKLQITPRDFRRLCILKGIYPRNPKRVKYGKDKVYYHLKDIKFLAYEPLLQRYWDLKTYFRKRHRAVKKGDSTRAKDLAKRRPRISLDHLVAERYPNFIAALNDMDDAVSMVALFAQLPSKLTRSVLPTYIKQCRALQSEWHAIVAHAGALEACFISIKGYVFRARLHGVPVTWIVPHPLPQLIPSDIDYRTMSTFLSFYRCALRFVLFKLYHDYGMVYPPPVDVAKSNQRVGFAGVLLQKNGAPATTTNSAAAPGSDGAEQKMPATDEKAQASVDKALEQLASSTAHINNSDPTPSNDTEAADDNAGIVEEDHQDGDNEAVVFSKHQARLYAQQKERKKRSQLFRNQVFYFNREVPRAPVQFVILSGGGTVRFASGDSVDAQSMSQESSSTLEKKSASQSSKLPTMLWNGVEQFGEVTHYVTERPVTADQYATGLKKCPKDVQEAAPTFDVVRPQWIFDSFNNGKLLPMIPYGPDRKAPPHLSPFVDDEREGYVPEQREVLRQWMNESRNDLAADKKKAESEEDSSESEQDDEEDKPEPVDDSSESEASRIERHKPKMDEETELRLLMTSKKTKRLYNRMMHSQGKKRGRAAQLTARRDEIDLQKGKKQTGTEATEPVRKRRNKRSSVKK